MKKDTVNEKEIDKFSKLADEWWDPEGKFKPLHNFNPVRLGYIKDTITKKFGIKSEKLPLKGIKILDIGCGGGLLSEPLSRLGATVTGIDASDRNIKIAKMHLEKSKLNINYYCSSPDKFVAKEKFDVILNMEIVEHVKDVNLFLKESSKFLKKNGMMFVATLNKTLKSYIFAIVGAEYILRWLPVGTHDWNMFVKPIDLIRICKNNSLCLDEILGVKYDVLTGDWKLSKDDDVNYMARFKKI